jgi:hypothetical protein
LLSRGEACSTSWKLDLEGSDIYGFLTKHFQAMIRVNWELFRADAAEGRTATMKNSAKDKADKPK